VRTQVAGLVVDGISTKLDRPTIAVQDWAWIEVPARVDVQGALAHWAGAFAVVLRRPRAGYPAGTTFLVGCVAADAPGAAPVPVSQPTAPAARSQAQVKQRKRKRVAHAHAHRSRPLKVTPPLHGGPYVFPVFGQSAFSDTYGAARSDVSGGWHHGDDIFAPLGAPILAVADGTVYTVGWNQVGGWRLWLRDRQGNRFYYAHLAGYTALARNGAHVKAGVVLAFVGNTGDAFTTPTHVHFEVHPVSLLRLHYDGAVDPTRYLDGWRHLRHVHVPRPAALPAGAAEDGHGAVIDYRRLLAARGLAPRRHRRRAAPPQAPTAPAILPTHNASAGVLPRPRLRASSGAFVLLLVLAPMAAALLLLLAIPDTRRRVLELARRRGGDDLPEAAAEENT
jgi:murein DD-endopeptidase MepM/ murein hydrolase activator NlpD